MKTFTALIVFAFLGLGLADIKYPTVAWVDCSQVEGGEKYFKCLELKMDSGVKIARLNKVDGLDEVLNGDIAGDEGSIASVSILDELIEVMIVDPEMGTLMFKYDTISGKSSEDSFPEDGVTHIDGEPLVNEEEEAVRSALLQRNLTVRNLPSQGMTMNVMVLYDSQFQRQFGSSVNTRITSIFNFAKNFFLLPSLGTRIYVNIVGRRYVNSAYSADGSNLR